jgi:hypothetical protein
MDIMLSGQSLGARVSGIDLAQLLFGDSFRAILRAPGERGVLCFPQQTLNTDPCSRDIALANLLHAQHVPMRNGKPLGETQFRNML